MLTLSVSLSGWRTRSIAKENGLEIEFIRKIKVFRKKSRIKDVNRKPTLKSFPEAFHPALSLLGTCRNKSNAEFIYSPAELSIIDHFTGKLGLDRTFRSIGGKEYTVSISVDTCRDTVFN